jgi:transcriptional regulator with GAF, ATPase, and Fis domain
MEEVARAAEVVHEFIGGASSLGDALHELSALATTAIDAAMAGLTMMNPQGKPKTVVYTDAMVPEVDEAQYQSERGPCLDAYRQRRIVHIDNFGEENRYPEFTRLAMQHDLHTSLSIPVVVGGTGIGALNFFHQKVGHFDDHSAETATIFARQCAVVGAYFDRAEQVDNLQRAIESRSEIEQAKGVIMASAGVSADEAFDVLRQQSQAENRKLREIAAEIVARQTRR